MYIYKVSEKHEHRHWKRNGNLLKINEFYEQHPGWRLRNGPDSIICRYVWNVRNKHKFAQVNLSQFDSVQSTNHSKVRLEFGSITKVNHVWMSCILLGTWIINQYIVFFFFFLISFFNHFYRLIFFVRKVRKRKREKVAIRQLR